MLSFLLDEHISPIVSEEIKNKRPEIAIFPLLFWQEGRYIGLDDEIILKAATDSQLTLVTYDQNTIPLILIQWGEANINHHGVIFIDYQTIKPNQFGKLVNSLIWLWDNQGNQSWRNRLIYLKPA
ncbi:MAG: DUF5615 family PIN-like protein [Crocosphaera sp.]|jgi:hypothetical protein